MAGPSLNMFEHITDVTKPLQLLIAQQVESSSCRSCDLTQGLHDRSSGIRQATALQQEGGVGCVLRVGFEKLRELFGSSHF